MGDAIVNEGLAWGGAWVRENFVLLEAPTVGWGY
jgi:hypothetical protein